MCWRGALKTGEEVEERQKESVRGEYLQDRLNVLGGSGPATVMGRDLLGGRH